MSHRTGEEMGPREGKRLLQITLQVMGEPGSPTNPLVTPPCVPPTTSTTHCFLYYRTQLGSHW